jgi:type II restriction enzyme
MSNSYCPNCGKDQISEYPNNQPVADFFCAFCNEDYELKSKNGNLGKKIVDGAYSSMIERITSDVNPNFFFLTYSNTFAKLFQGKLYHHILWLQF